MYYKHIKYTDILSHMHIYLYSMHKEHDKKISQALLFLISWDTNQILDMSFTFLWRVQRRDIFLMPWIEGLCNQTPEDSLEIKTK